MIRLLREKEGYFCGRVIVEVSFIWRVIFLFLLF